MAIKKIQIKPPDNSYADVLHPETDSTQVLMNGGNTLQIDFDAHKADNVYQTAGGTATAIILTINETLINGLPINFIVASSNNGSATTINGKKFYKPNTTTAPNLIAGKPVTAIYNSTGDCFFIKASAEGDAVVADVLAGKKFSNDNDIGLTGTMTNQGAKILTPSTANIAIPQGYHNGNGYVQGDADLVSENILTGKNIFGVVGSAINGDGMTKHASGTGYQTNASTTLPFNHMVGSTSNSDKPYVTISGLTFTPKIIKIFQESETIPHGTTMYSSMGLLIVESNNLIGNIGMFYGGWNIADLEVQVGSTDTNFYVNAAGFRLPVYTGNSTIQWPIWWEAWG